MSATGARTSTGKLRLDDQEAFLLGALVVAAYVPEALWRHGSTG